MTTKIFLFLKKEHSPYVSLLLTTQKQICTKLRTQKRIREDVTMQSLRTYSKLLSSPRPFFLKRADGAQVHWGKQVVSNHHPASPQIAPGHSLSNLMELTWTEMEPPR